MDLMLERANVQHA